MGVATVNVNAERVHPLGRIGHAACLAHAAPAVHAQGTHVQPVYHLPGPAPGNNALDAGGIVMGGVDKLVLDTDLFQCTVHNQSADRAPAL